MISAVCTLFEGHYHFGVAALSNSLCNQGYRGNIYAGYRGALPGWALDAKKSTSINWPGCRTLQVADGLQLHFLPLDTDYHFTNYKPDFMLRIWEQLACDAQNMFYFDPDIVVAVPWVLFEEWITCGIALCEDINSPIAANHPVRIAWRRYFGERGFSLCFKESIYVNGGFIGVQEKDKGFLSLWQVLQENMATAIGGLNRSAFTNVETHLLLHFSPFGLTDQDALNATVEAWKGPSSLVGKEGMSFKVGNRLMSHALGRLKPWITKPLSQALIGHRVRLADRDYWQSANGPIISQPAYLVRCRQLGIQVAAFLGRFYIRK